MNSLDTYCDSAMRCAKVEPMEDDPRFVATIPGFKGLYAVGQTEQDACEELRSVLAGWVDLSLRRGRGLPKVSASAPELVTAH